MKKHKEVWLSQSSLYSLLGNLVGSLESGTRDRVVSWLPQHHQEPLPSPGLWVLPNAISPGTSEIKLFVEMLGKSQCGGSILILCYDKSKLWETFVHCEDEYLSPQHMSYLLSIFSKSQFTPRNSKLPSNISWLAFSFWSTELGILSRRAPLPSQERLRPGVDYSAGHQLFWACREFFCLFQHILIPWKA